MKKYFLYLLFVGLLFPLFLYAMSFGLIPEKVIQKAEKKYGVYARNRYQSFNVHIAKLKNSPTSVKLETVNNFFNDVPYRSDMKVWSKKDYWATPFEFLGIDKGDCEDYVIAKYYALRALDIENKHLFFSYVKSTQFKGAHMVLSYFETPTSIPLILDNNNFKIFPANKRQDLIPIYNFNGEALYLAKRQGQQGKKITKQKKIHKKWDQLMHDIQRNKI